MLAQVGVRENKISRGGLQEWASKGCVLEGVLGIEGPRPWVENRVHKGEGGALSPSLRKGKRGGDDARKPEGTQRQMSSPLVCSLDERWPLASGDILNSINLLFLLGISKVIWRGCNSS